MSHEGKERRGRTQLTNEPRAGLYIVQWRITPHRQREGDGRRGIYAGWRRGGESPSVLLLTPEPLEAHALELSAFGDDAYRLLLRENDANLGGAEEALLDHV